MYDIVITQRISSGWSQNTSRTSPKWLQTLSSPKAQVRGSHTVPQKGVKNPKRKELFESKTERCREAQAHNNSAREVVGQENCQQEAGPTDLCRRPIAFQATRESCVQESDVSYRYILANVSERANHEASSSVLGARYSLVNSSPIIASSLSLSSTSSATAESPGCLLKTLLAVK